MHVILFSFFWGCGEPKEVNPVYFDADGDGFTSEIDCDDEDESINPDAQEVCDGVDNDCDSLIDDEDDGAELLVFYSDLDGDGIGSAEVLACSMPSGSVAEGGDCNDEDESINPDAQEICDDVDNDCDSLIDDEDDSLSSEQMWYVDNDGDDFGGVGSGGYWCAPPSDLITVGEDCDDEDGSINPNAQEICDDLDNDCDGFVDGEDDSLDLSDASNWYRDADGDGSGNPEDSLLDCVTPSGYVSNALDCDDESAGLQHLDEDGDGQSTCAGDCDDFDGLAQSCLECVDTNLYSDLGVDLYTGTLMDDVSWEGECSASSASTLRWKAPYSDTFVFRMTSSSQPSFSFLGDCESELSCSVGYEHERFVEGGETVYLGLQGEEGQEVSLSIGTPFELSCSDGIDDDADGLLDCDDEEDCWYDPACSLGSCPDYDLIDPVQFTPATSLLDISLVASGNDLEGSCISDDGNEYSYFWESPITGCLQLIATSDEVDVGLYIFEECSGEELFCNDDSSFVTSQFGVQFGSYLELDVVQGSSWIFVLESENAAMGMADLILELNDTIYCDGSPVE